MKLNIKPYIIPRLLLAAIILLTCILSPIQLEAQINITNTLGIDHSDTSVKLTWVSVPNAASYEIYRDGSLIYTNSVQNDMDPFSYTDSSLAPETTYTYEVRALDAGNVQLDTGTITATTGFMQPPSIVDAVFDVNTRNVTLQWVNNSDAVTGSTIQSHNSGAITPSSSTLTGCIFHDNDLDSGPASYNVYSNDLQAGHESAPSDTITITPIDPPTISAYAEYGSVYIDPGTYPDIGYFKAERSKWSGTQWGAWQVVGFSNSGTDLIDDSDAAGIFRYRLSARHEEGYSGYSNISNNVIRPGAPTNLQCNLTGQNKITLTWTNNPDNQSELQIYRWDGVGHPLVIATLSPSSSTYEDNFSFVSGTTYHYGIVAYEALLNADAGDAITYTPSIPAAPTNLYVIAKTPADVTVNWTDNANNEEEYVVERSVNSGSFSALLSGIAPNSGSANITGLTPGNTYRFRVRASNYMGGSLYSNEVSITPTDPVTAPNSLTASVASATQVDLSWTFNAAGNYSTRVERKTGTAGTWTTVATTGSGAKSYSDTGLSPNTQYFYRIRTVLAPNVYSESYPANSTGTEAITKLAAITLYGNATSANQIYLNWTGGTSSSEFTIERKLADGGYIAVKTFTSGETSWYDSGVIPNGTYIYRIKGKNTSNETTYSNEVTVINTYLDPPTGLTANTNSEGFAELAWNDNCSSESGYEVWRYISGATGGYQLYAVLDANTKAYTDTNVQAGSQYNYMVRAFTLANNAYSSFTSTASTGTGILTPPGNLTYRVVSDSQATLSWNDNSSNESGFKVDRKIGLDGDWITMCTLLPNTTSYTITGLVPNLRYYFRVRAYSYSYNTDSFSNETGITTGKPDIPSNVKLTALGPRNVSITWSDTSNNTKYYIISRKRANDTYVGYAGTVQAGAATFTDLSLIPGFTYYYKVAAYNDSGSASSEFLPVTLPLEVTFSDIKNHFARTAIENLAGLGIIADNNGGPFRPNNTISRAEFVCMLVRAFGLGSINGGTMADVKPDKWYYGELMAARKLGIISPDSNDRFYPDKPITREDMAVIIVNMLRAAKKPLKGYSSSVLERFTDKKLIAPYAISAMSSVCGEKIMEGSGSRLNPKNSATRGEAAVLVSKVINR